jgi:hypothetical protein
MIALAQIIHLKRFRYDNRYREKLNLFVDFPIAQLDMSPFVLDPETSSDSCYDLFAVCVWTNNFKAQMCLVNALLTDSSYVGCVCV